MFIYGSASVWCKEGVVLLVRKNRAMALMSAQLISPRIISSRPALKIVAVYAATEDAAKDIKERFYQELWDCVFDLPQNDLLLITRAFNARIGAVKVLHGW